MYTFLNKGENISMETQHLNNIKEIYLRVFPSKSITGNCSALRNILEWSPLFDQLFYQIRT